MRTSLTFAGSSLEIDVPEDITLDRFSPKAAESPVGWEGFLTAWQRAGAPDFAAAGDTLLVVVNDAYRNTPTPLVLNWLERAHPTLIDRAQFIVATGAHASPSPDQMCTIFGERFSTLNGRIAVHDSKDRSQITIIGQDSLGGDVGINSAVLTAGQILIISSVEPHYFAGYTGGRKSLFPGLTDQATVARNHNLANSMQAAPLQLAGNPVAEHLDELLRLVDTDRCMAIQLVLDCRRQIAGVSVGRLEDAFRRSLKLADHIYAHQVSPDYDLALCELLPPLDANLYQAQKALENCQSAVRDGGAVALVTACAEGIGSESFYRLAATWNRESNCPRSGCLQFGSHKLSRVVEHGRRIRLFVYSRLSPETVRAVFYEPLDNLPEFLFRESNDKAGLKMALVRDAGNTVLRTDKPL